MAEKYRIELRNRRRTASETLQGLHSNIRRLAALAYNSVTPEMRDQVTCDSFLDALGDPELAFKIRERQPSDLDSALRIALQLEVWAKEMHRHREAMRPEKSESRRVLEINRKHNSNTEVQKEVENTKKFVGYGRGAPRNPNAGTYASGHRPPAATRYAAPSVYGGPATPPNPRGQYPAQSYNGYGNRNGNFYRAPNPFPGCYSCGDPAHQARECPTRPDQPLAPQPQPPTQQQPDVRPMKDHSTKQEKTCIRVKYRQHKLNALLDTRSDVGIAGEDVARKMGWTIHAHRTKEVGVANNKTMPILGATRVILVVAGHGVKSEILIAPDLDGLILGIDWLRCQGRIKWDFDKGRIKFGKREWVALKQETEQPIRTSIIRKDFSITDRGSGLNNREIGYDGSDFHAAPTGSARRFCCSTLNWKFLREVSLFCRAMFLVESRRERGKTSELGVRQCVSGIRRRVRDDVFATLSLYLPRLPNLRASYLIV